MSTTLARLASVPQASAMPERVELIHCQTAGRIVSIRLDSGRILYVFDKLPGADDIELCASESAITYTANADALVQAAKDGAEWNERLDREDWEEETLRLLEASVDARVQNEAEEIADQRTDELTRQVDVANDLIRDLRDELEERQSRVDELCEEIERLKDALRESWGEE